MINVQFFYTSILPAVHPLYRFYFGLFHKNVYNVIIVFAKNKRFFLNVCTHGNGNCCEALAALMWFVYNNNRIIETLNECFHIHVEPFRLVCVGATPWLLITAANTRQVEAYCVSVRYEEAAALVTQTLKPTALFSPRHGYVRSVYAHKKMNNRCREMEVSVSVYS